MVANLSHAFQLFILFSVIVFDLNHAAIRQRRTLPLPLPTDIFGRMPETRISIGSIFGGLPDIISVSTGGSNKEYAEFDPCNPQQNIRSASTLKPALIEINIPSIFPIIHGRPTVPRKCPPVSAVPSKYPSKGPIYPYLTVTSATTTTSKIQVTYSSTNINVENNSRGPLHTLPTEDSLLSSSNSFVQPSAVTPTTEPVSSSESTKQYTPQVSKVTKISTEQYNTTSVSVSVPAEATITTTDKYQDIVDSIFNLKESSTPPGDENTTENNGSGVIDLRLGKL